MGVLFGWLPMPSALDVDSWQKFLDLFAAIFVVLLLATCAVAVLGYRQSAARRRIFSHADVFRGYTPMRWLWTALGGAIVTAIACAVTYVKTTDVNDGVVPTSCEFFLLMLVLSFLLSYLAMVFGPVTPRKFRNRPGALLRGNK